MRKLSNILATALVAVTLTSGLGASVAYAASDDANVQDQVIVMSQEENGAGNMLSEFAVNNDTLFSSNQGNSAQNGASDGQFVEMYNDTNIGTTGSGEQEAGPANLYSQESDLPEMPESAAPLSEGLQVADATSGDNPQSADQPPVISIYGDVIEHTGNIKVTVSNVYEESWKVIVRVFGESDTVGSGGGLQVGSRDFTSSTGEETYQYTISLNNKVKKDEHTTVEPIVAGSTMGVYLMKGDNVLSYDTVTIKSGSPVPATITWGAGDGNPLDVLTYELHVTVDFGTAGLSTRTGEAGLEVYISQNQGIFNGFTSDDGVTNQNASQLGSRLLIRDDGEITIPISLNSLLDYYIGVQLMVHSVENVGFPVFTHTAVRHIVATNDSAQLSVSYDIDSSSYTLTGSVDSPSRQADQYKYTWFDSADNELGTGATFTGVAESQLDGLYLVVSVPSESVAFLGQRIYAFQPVWGNSDVVVATSPQAGVVNASWPAVGRIIEQTNVNVAALSYLVRLMNGDEQIAMQTVTNTQATFEGVAEGTYNVVVIPMNTATINGDERWSSAVEVEAAQDDPVIIDPDPIIYTVTSADEWVKGSGEAKAFHGEGLFASFTGATLDGVELNESLYTLSEGSTVLTLAASYLETLSTGVHTFGMQWSDGAGSKTFSVVAQTDPEPEPNVEPEPEPENEEPKAEENVIEEEQPVAETKPAPAAAEPTTTVVSGNGTMPQTADPMGTATLLFVVLALVSAIGIRRSSLEK